MRHFLPSIHVRAFPRAPILGKSSRAVKSGQLVSDAGNSFTRWWSLHGCNCLMVVTEPWFAESHPPLSPYRLDTSHAYFALSTTYFVSHTISIQLHPLLKTTPIKTYLPHSPIRLTSRLRRHRFEMHITTLLPLALLLFCFLHIPIAEAKCCNPDAGGDCKCASKSVSR